jgi:hypothetical protein
MAPRKNIMRPLHLIFAIILVSVLFYLLVQVRLGYISCNLGRFPGVQGRIPWLEKYAATHPKMQSTKNFVNQVKASIQNSDLSSKEMYKQLSKLEGPEGQDLLAFASTTTDEHEKGTLLVRTGSSLAICDSVQPYCRTIKEDWVGKNLWDLKIQDGSYEVREWISLAEDGGGWMGSYWKNPLGEIIPKFVYVVNVPTKNLILLSTIIQPKS